MPAEHHVDEAVVPVLLGLEVDARLRHLAVVGHGRADLEGLAGHGARHLLVADRRRVGAQDSGGEQHGGTGGSGLHCQVTWFE
jgi:hypothetical protein